MLFALVSVVAMGQEVKVDTVAADSLTADTVKADTYVEQEGMTVYAEIKDHFTHDPVKMRCVTLLMAADSAFVDTVPTYYENEEDYKSSHLYKGFKEAGKYLFKLEADGYQTMFVPFELKKIYKRETLRELKTVYLKPVPKKNEMMLDEVVVKATKLKFYMDGDTLVYDADAFNLAEGSMLGELMKKLPGVEVEQGGVAPPFPLQYLRRGTRVPPRRSCSTSSEVLDMQRAMKNGDRRHASLTEKGECLNEEVPPRLFI